MKILFICGSLEPGRDGVGDYTRRLAAECIRQGSPATIVALNDKGLTAPQPQESVQHDGDTAVRCLRLPQSLPWKARVEAAGSWKSDFDPDILSLQFVPYSFHPKGLPFGLASRLKQIGGATPWHTMFHELWLGMETGAPPREFMIGAVQRGIVRNLLGRLRPVCHTQCDLYRRQLEGLRITAEQLPLFGNIPLIPARSPACDNTAVRNFVVFGGIHHSAPFDSFARELKALNLKKHPHSVLHFVGRNGKEKQQWLRACHLAGVETSDHGEQSAPEISNTLQSCDYGVATTPYPLIQKSGAAAAMLEHGLPVLCVARSWIPRIPSTTPAAADVAEYQQGALEHCLATITRPIGNSLRQVAGRFIRDIEKP